MVIPAIVVVGRILLVINRNCNINNNKLLINTKDKTIKNYYNGKLKKQ